MVDSLRPFLDVVVGHVGEVLCGYSFCWMLALMETAASSNGGVRVRRHVAACARLESAPRTRAAPAVALLPVGPTEAAPKRKRKASHRLHAAYDRWGIGVHQPGGPLVAHRTVSTPRTTVGVSACTNRVGCSLL